MLASVLNIGRLLKGGICSLGRKFFPITLDFILTGLRHLGNQAGLRKSCFPL